MKLWGYCSLHEIWKKQLAAVCENPTCPTKTETNKAYDRTIKEIDRIRHMPIDYSTFNPDFSFSTTHTEIVKDFKSPDRIMGRCPCPADGEQTRCCNLRTLDAVQQCAFACAYCSIQSFYSQNQIKVVSDLDSYLENLVLDREVWHIGTGQSSDSLLLGDDYGTLTALGRFASRHPEVALELKTKCSRTDWLSLDLPANIISTWSLNAPTVAVKEEHLAASIKDRIAAASRCASKGRLVGFHIHPMVYFSDYEKEYSSLVHMLCDNIDPDNAVMVGIGTLTFTKPTLKALRQSGRPTRVTQMAYSQIAGKFSYPLEVKQKLFSLVYRSFPQDWKDKVFFYLCMEDPSLWEPCLGRSYSCNADFEADMKKHYMEKIGTRMNKDLHKSHS